MPAIQAWYMGRGNPLGALLRAAIDGSEANAAAIKGDNEEHGTSIPIRKIKSLNNIIEQEHRGIKWVNGPIRPFKSVDLA
jgi:transposase-like protein